MSVRGDRQKQQGSLLGILQGLMTPGDTLSGRAALDKQAFISNERLNQIREAAGLPEGKPMQYPTAELLTGLAGGTTQSLGATDEARAEATRRGVGFFRRGSDPTPVSQIPVVQDISSLLQGIRNRQRQTSANLRAIDARDSDDLGTAPTAINKQLSDLSASLADRPVDTVPSAVSGAFGGDDIVTETETTGAGASTTTDGGSESSNANQAAQVEAAGTGAGTDGDKKGGALNDIFSKVMQDIDSFSQGEQQEPKSLDEYKQEFADATGINISGNVDKSHALMAFGLSLMQNKAGKGFNISNILGEVGAAGEAAMPAFLEAKKEARANQIAAGKYALQERKAAAATLAANRKDNITYLRDRRDAVLDRMADREDEQTKAYTKYLYDRNIELLKQQGKAAEAQAEGKEFKGLYDDKLLPGNEQMKVKYGYIGTTPYFANPVNDARAVANQYVKASKTMESIDELESILKYYQDTPTPSGQILFDKGIDFLNAYGIVDGQAWFDERGISPAARADVIVDALIQENKRFISQETGNGVSNSDKQDIATVIGRININDPVDKNIERLDKLRRIFAAPMNVLAGQLQAFQDIDNYAEQGMFDKTQQMLSTELAYLQQRVGTAQGGAPIDVRS